MTTPADATSMPRWRLSGLAFALVLTACTATGPSASPVASPTESQAPAPETPAPSPSGPPTVALEDVATFDLEAREAPDWPDLLDGSLWVLVPDGDDPAVLRMDPETGAEQARISLPGGACEMLIAGFGSIWACTPDGFVRIDPATNTIATSVPFLTPDMGVRPAVSEDAVWSLSGDIVATDVVRIDPASNAVTATYPLGHSVAQIAYGLGYLWATAMRDGLLLRIDPASGEVAVAATDLVDPLAVATGAGHVWVGLQGTGTDEDPDPAVPDLFRFDPETGSGGFFDYGFKPLETKSANGLLVTETDVWLKGTAPFLMRLDPESGEIEWVVTSDYGSGAMVIANYILWIAVWRENSVLRIDL